MSSKIWACSVFIPATIHREIREMGIERLWCTLNGSERFSCALMPGGDGKWFINVNAERQKKLGIAPGDTLHVHLSENTSKYGIEIAEEFEVLLEQDEEGSHYFHQLTPGKQRNLIHIVTKPKSSEVRLKKALVVMSYLKHVRGKLDFKELNEAFKQANRS